MLKLAADKRQTGVAAIMLLVAMTVVVYWRLCSNGFVNFDDQVYIIENTNLQKGLSADSIAWAFSLAGEGHTYWHPLTWLSLMTDYSLFGLSPAGFHLMNLLFHLANTMLLFLFLNTLSKRFLPSAIVAALFAFHPLNVESVAWAVERKTVLSGFFFLLTLLAYGNYTKKPNLWRYLLVACLFMLGLMAKSSILALPFVLLLLDYWPLFRGGNEYLVSTEGREGNSSFLDAQPLPVRMLLLEKIPLLVLSILSVVVVISSSREHMHGGEWTAVTFADKCANAAVSYVAYIVKMFWPSRLAVYYPLQMAYPLWEFLGAVLLLAGVTVLVIRSGRIRPWLVVGWFWYLCTLFPAIGFVRSGLWPAMADRFSYLPLVGLFVVIAFGAEEIADRFAGARVFVYSGISVAILVLGVVTNIQTSYWKDTVSLFEHTTAVTSRNAKAYGMLGNEYFRRGDYRRAFASYRKEQEAEPLNGDYEYMLARYYLDRGEVSAAVDMLNQCLEKDENHRPARYLLGEVYERLGKYEEAILTYGKIELSVMPDDLGYKKKARESRNRLISRFSPQLDVMRKEAEQHPRDHAFRQKLALRLDNMGLYDEALQNYHELERQGGGNWQLFFNMANVYKKTHKRNEARDYYEKSLQLNPVNPDAVNNLGAVYNAMKQYPQAISAFEKAISMDNRFFYAHFNLVRTYEQMGQEEKSLQYLNSLLEQFPEWSPKIAPYMKAVKMKVITKRG